MTVSEVKEQIDAMTDDERFSVAAYLQHLANERDPAHMEALAAANRRINEGHKESFEELLARHEALERSGK